MSLEITAILDNLEQELKLLQLWSSLPPDPVAMNSELPFCYDTMPLENWLQYIFLPRFRELIAADLPLPGKLAISPIAEEAFKTLGNEANSLLAVIARLDQAFNQP